MAFGVSTSADILAALKLYYGDQFVANLLFRNSPVLKKIKKIRIAGKQYPLPMMYSRGGAVSGDYTVVQNLATQNFGAKEMLIEPGKLFSSFVLDPMEYASSANDKGAYMSLLALKAFASLEALRKTLAVALYGRGYGELGQVVAVDGTSQLYFDVYPSAAMGLDVGSNILFTVGLGSAPRSGTASVVTAIGDSPTAGLVRVTVGSAYSATVAINDFVYISGGVDASYAPNLPMGLGGWLPTVADRSGATWTSYIGTSFFGVNRSAYVNRLAGSFVKRNSGGGEKYYEAISRLIASVRRNGGVPDMIVLNDVDYQSVMNELQANRNFWQQINTGGKTNENKVVQGLSQMQFAFSTSWLEYVADDPYCPQGTFYILESESVMFLGLTNAAPVTEDKGPANNDPGAPKTTGATEPTTNFQFMVDDYYTTKPATTTAGTGVQVDFNLFGSFAVSAPAHCGVGKF